MRANEQGRFYRLAVENDSRGIAAAAERLEQHIRDHQGPLTLLPDEPTPPNNGHRAVGSLVIYGMDQWCDLFTARQSLTLATLCQLVATLPKPSEPR